MNVLGSFSTFFRVDFFQNLRFHRTMARVTAAIRTDIPINRRTIQVIVGGIVLVVAVKYYYSSTPTYPNIVTPETLSRAGRTAASGISTSYECFQRYSVSMFHRFQ